MTTLAEAVEALGHFRECLTDPHDFDEAMSDLRQRLADHDVSRETSDAVIYVPPRRDVLNEVTHPMELRCPKCESTEVVQVDTALRWNVYSEEVEDPNVIVWGTDGDYDWGTDHYLCTACTTELNPPPGTLLAADHPDRIDEDYS